jgi:hypothetical protein
MGKTSGQNSPVSFFAQCRENGQKFSKKLQTQLQRPSGPYPSRVILVSWSTIYEQNISSKAIEQLVPFPR